MYPRFSCLLFGNPCVSPSSVTILNHVWFTIAPLSPFFPSHHPLLPPRALREDDWGRSQVVFSLPASRVDFDVLEDDCMTQPHFLQSSLKKAKEYFEATCNVKVIFYAANMKYYLETLRHSSFEYEHWGAYATTTATGKKTSLKNGNSPYFKLHRA